MPVIQKPGRWKPIIGTGIAIITAIGIGIGIGYPVWSPGPAIPAVGGNLAVSPTGSDTACPGTRSATKVSYSSLTPCQTLKKACSLASPGDTILLDNSAPFTVAQQPDGTCNGAPGNPIVFQDNGPGVDFKGAICLGQTNFSTCSATATEPSYLVFRSVEGVKIVNGARFGVDKTAQPGIKYEGGIRLGGLNNTIDGGHVAFPSATTQAIISIIGGSNGATVENTQVGPDWPDMDGIDIGGGSATALTQNYTITANWIHDVERACDVYPGPSSVDGMGSPLAPSQTPTCTGPSAHHTDCIQGGSAAGTTVISYNDIAGCGDQSIFLAAFGGPPAGFCPDTGSQVGCFTGNISLIGNAVGRGNAAASEVHFGNKAEYFGTTNITFASNSVDGVMRVDPPNFNPTSTSPTTITYTNNISNAPSCTAISTPPYTATYTFSHNAFQTGTCGTGDISIADLTTIFMSTTYSLPLPDLRPQAGSAVINAGDNATAPPTDLTGTTRPQGTTTDIGAYEVG